MICYSDIFNFISTLARELLGFAENGVAFLTSTSTSQLPWFLITVIPAVIFFVSIVSVLYYWGTLQWFVRKAAVFFFWSMRVSGAEAVVAAASPFIGQGESAMLIKPFVAHLTLAELHQVMTSGFATIAGSVLVAYIGLGVNGTALISSCVMSIPASLALRSASSLSFIQTRMLMPVVASSAGQRLKRHSQPAESSSRTTRNTGPRILYTHLRTGLGLG